MTDIIHGTGKLKTLQSRIHLHQAFWNRKAQDHPIAAFRIEKDFFFSRHFQAAQPLLSPNKIITPSMLNVEDFLADYERMFNDSEEVGQDAFWTAEPFTGIPWMEAILGCQILAGDESFVSRPWMKSLEELDSLSFDPENHWFQKYLEFTRELVRYSRGRFPIGMPIMRGPSDVVGAIMGQTEMVYALIDEPKRMKTYFLKVADIFLKVQAEQQNIIPSFYGGTSLGFYHVFCPGRSIWFQDDLSALFSPDLYREFLVEPAKKICEGYEYTAFHLHPASFSILDELLNLPNLKAIEVNKDVGGPTVKEMIPELKKILSKKSLILFGDLTDEDLAIIREKLPRDGLFFHIVVPTLTEARSLLQFIRAW